MKEEPIIQVRNVKIEYGEEVILEDVSFDIHKGEIFVIVGGSGCGKSALMRQIIGLETPAEGEILINGVDFTKAEGETREQIKKNFGVMFQSGGLFASMNVEENLALPLQSYTNLREERIEDLIDMNLSAVGLRGTEDYLPAELSGGMKKRTAIARALTLNPDILCFDEPSSGLDPITAAAIDKLIKDLNSALKTTMVVVTHDLSSIEEISHDVVMLDKKSKGIIAQGKPEDLKNSDNEFVYKFFNRIP